MARHLTSKWTAVTLAALLLPAIASGCGRKGDPLKPSEAAIDRAKANKEPAPEKPTPNKENPDKRFILDGILE